MHPLSLSLFAACLSSVWLMERKALEDFVNLPDTHYNYTLLEKEQTQYFFIFLTIYTIKMTSQKWLDESEVNKPVWSHNLKILLPKTEEPYKSCLLIILFDQDVAYASHFLNSRMGQEHITGLIKTPLAVLSLVLPQPLTFYKHPLGRKNIKGHDIIAYSWWRFMNDPDAPPHWLVQFPMVKAVVRAMDTITDFMKKTHDENLTEFMLIGISVGGWATWLTAAVDSRVIGINSVGLDLLNFTENFRHQFRAYCGWSYMWRPYYEMNITQELDSPRFSLLASYVDPIEYNERYANIPKYINIASGDEFLPPDSTYYYFSQLEGEKYLRIMPDDNYHFKKVMKNITPLIFYFVIAKNLQRPSVSWQRTMTNTTGIIHFKADIKPCSIYSFHAETIGGSRRDFRMTIAAGNSSQNSSVKWIQSEVENVENGLYKKEIEIPAVGWKAFFIQASFRLIGISCLIITSEIYIIPDTFPCPDCNGDGCRGTLV